MVAAAPSPYKDVANNAFYCSAGDFLAWDAQGLIPTIQQQFGDFAVALVAAHELGHAIQERTGTSAGSTIPLELQADCFAGAWAQHATTTTKDTFNVKKGDLEEALSGYLYFRDPTGTDPTTEGAHGSAFDRISAFNDGFSGGVQRCKNYDTEPPTVTEVPYTSSNDVARRGNLPFSDLVKLRATGPQRVLEISAGFDAGHLVRARRGKDEAMREERQQAGRHVFGRARRLPSRNATRGIRQVRRQRCSHPHGRSVGRHGDPEGKLPSLGSQTAATECMAGAWVGDLVNGTRMTDTTLSPGDLDEAVSALLALQDTRQRPTTASYASTRPRRASSTGPPRAASSRRDRALGDPHRRTAE